MVIQKFEDIVAWQKAQEFAFEIHSIFHSSKDFSFKDQINRAVISISNNIAEGFDRSSNAEFSRFLYFSLGSCSEVKSMLYLAKKFDYISDLEMNALVDQSSEISKIFRGLIKSIEPKKTNSINKPI